MRMLATTLSYSAWFMKPCRGEKALHTGGRSINAWMTSVTQSTHCTYRRIKCFKSVPGKGADAGKGGWKQGRRRRGNKVEQGWG